MEIVNIELIIKSYSQMLSSSSWINFQIYCESRPNLWLQLFLTNPGEFFSFTPTQITSIVFVYCNL